MQRLLAMIGTISFLLAATLGLMHAMPLSDATRELVTSDCAPPCWYGIEPGKTTVEAASVRLRSMEGLVQIVEDSQRLCWKTAGAWFGCALRSVSTPGPITSIDWQAPPGIKLGTLISIFGSPIAFRACRGVRAIYGHVFFANNIEALAVNWTGKSGLYPGMEVEMIRYHYVASEPPYPFDTPRWHGFTSLDWNYC